MANVSNVRKRFNKRAPSKKRSSRRKYKARSGGGSAKYPRPRPSRSRIDFGAPVYVPGKKSQFYITGESTGLQVKKLGTFKIPQFSPKPVKTMGTYSYHNVTQWVMYSGQGNQNVDYVEPMLVRNNLIGATNNTRTDRLSWAIDPYEFSPIIHPQLNNLYANNNTTPFQSDVLYIKKIDVKIEMLNMTLIPQQVKIYFISPNFDTAINPIDHWNNILAAKNQYLNVAGPVNDIATTLATPGAARAVEPGANPFVHAEFRNQWTTINSVNVVLQAGEQVNFSFTIDVNKVVNKQTFVDQRTSQYLRGLTVFPLTITKAGMAGIATTEAAESSEVAYGEVKVGVISNQTFTFGALPTTRKSTTVLYPGTIHDATQGATAESQKIIDDNDKIILANARL